MDAKPTRGEPAGPDIATSDARGDSTRDRSPAPAGEPPLLDTYLPDYDVTEFHVCVVNADAETTWAAIRHGDLAGIPVVRALLLLRALPGRVRALAARAVRIDGEIVINRPVDEVFDFVADERNEPRYNPRLLRVVQISPGAIGLGTRFRAEIKTMGRALPMTIEFTGFERPRQLASRTRLSTMEIRGALTFDPVSRGTRMRWSWVIEPHGGLKLMTPMLARIGRRQEQAIWANLKRHLDARD